MGALTIDDLREWVIRGVDFGRAAGSSLRARPGAHGAVIQGRGSRVIGFERG